MDTKRTVYEADLQKSSANLKHEFDPELQELLTRAYHAPLDKKVLNSLNFSSKLYVPQSISTATGHIQSTLNQVSYTVNGSEKIIVDNVTCPWVKLSPKGDKLLMAYYRNNAAMFSVYNLTAQKMMTGEIAFPFLGEILGFNEPEDEVYVSRVNEKSNNLNSEIIKLNLATQQKETLKFQHSWSIYFEHASRLLNGRYAMAYERFKRYIAVYDLQTNKVMYLPGTIAFNDLESYRGDTLLALYSRNLLIEFTYDVVAEMFPFSYMTKYDKMSIDKETKEYLKWSESLLDGTKVIGGIQLKTIENPKTIEKLVNNRVHTEELYNVFAKEQSIGNAYCSVLGLLSKVYVDAAQETYFMNVNRHIQVGLINNCISINSTEYNKAYELDYYPIKVLDFNDNNMTVRGVDKYGFAIVKVYDFASLYSKYNIKGG